MELIHEAIEVVKRSQDAVALVPKPAHVLFTGGSFELSSKTKLLFEGSAPDTKMASELLGTKLRIPIDPASAAGERTNSICLSISDTQSGLGPESYELIVSPREVSLRAPKAAGLFYGAQTLRQFFPPAIERRETPGDGKWKIPCARVIDQPRFRWRGLLIDCSRTFQVVESLKRYIDLLAYHKLNVLHLHMTDDQGWRMEIKSHPELTDIGSRFEEKYQEPGGFYTQDDLRDLIAYAKARQVMLVPEIEMPGHCLAALKARPELSCTGGPFEIYPFFHGPWIQENVFCAGNDAVFELLADVLAEVAELFPSPYIHIGGDEVPKSNWHRCPKCQKRRQFEGLKDEQELQSYFIHRIAKIVQAVNRRLIGWDEILEGGLAEGAIVMSWRGMAGGRAALRAGHEVIFCPTSHCYFDYDYEQISLQKTHSFEPAEGLSPDEEAHILGVQANMWTHLARDDAAVDGQLFPRLAALAEVAWSPRRERDWPGFSQAMAFHFRRLAGLGVPGHE